MMGGQETRTLRGLNRPAESLRNPASHGWTPRGHKRCWQRTHSYYSRPEPDFDAMRRKFDKAAKKYRHTGRSAP